jgi:hypothetical protein
MHRRAEVAAGATVVMAVTWGTHGITWLTITHIAATTRIMVTRAIVMRIMVTRIMLTRGMPAATRRRSLTVAGIGRRDSAAGNRGTGKVNG